MEAKSAPARKAVEIDRVSTYAARLGNLAVDGFEPVSVGSDGSFTSYAQKSPREFILSNSFTF